MCDTKEKVVIDMWYGDKAEDADSLSVSFYPNGCEYRGNIYREGRVIGDFATKDSCAIEDSFPQIQFNWD